MNRHRLLTAAAAVWLTLPVAGLADPPADRGGRGGQDRSQQQEQDKGHDQGRGHDKGGHGKGGQPGGPRGPQGPPGPAVTGGPPPAPAAVQPPRVRQGGHAVTGRQGQGGRRQGHGGPPRGQAGAAVGAGGRPGFVAGPGAGVVQAQPGRVGDARRQAQDRRTVRPPADVPALSGWNRSARGPGRAQAGEQWRQAHRGWDNRTPWRSNRTWWRGNAAFRLFRGERLGFFFVPAFGYVSVPMAYRSHYWRAGEQLPNWFWRYQVRDYWNYGLPRPPDGCIWVWVNNNVALIDASDGYIIDVVYNAW